mgnify:CR=1 FL=1
MIHSLSIIVIENNRLVSPDFLIQLTQLQDEIPVEEHFVVDHFDPVEVFIQANCTSPVCLSTSSRRMALPSGRTIRAA